MMIMMIIGKWKWCDVESHISDEDELVSEFENINDGGSDKLEFSDG